MSTASFTEEGTERHRIPKYIFEQLDGLHRIVAEQLIAKGDWVLV